MKSDSILKNKQTRGGVNSKNTSRTDPDASKKLNARVSTTDTNMLQNSHDY